MATTTAIIIITTINRVVRAVTTVRVARAVRAADVEAPAAGGLEAARVAEVVVEARVGLAVAAFQAVGLLVVADLPVVGAGLQAAEEVPGHED